MPLQCIFMLCNLPDNLTRRLVAHSHCGHVGVCSLVGGTERGLAEFAEQLFTRLGLLGAQGAR